MQGQRRNELEREREREREKGKDKTKTSQRLPDLKADKDLDIYSRQRHTKITLYK